MEELPQWAAAAFLAAVFTVFAVYNGLFAWARFVAHSPAPSLAPIFGGLFGAGAVLSLPLGTIADRLCYAWIPLLLDVSIPITVVALLREWRKK